MEYLEQVIDALFLDLEKETPLEPIQIKQLNHILKVEITKDCLLDDYNNYIKNYPKQINIPIGYYKIETKQNNQYLKKQTVYTLKYQDKHYYIIKGRNQMQLIEERKTSDYILETIIKIENGYSILQYQRNKDQPNYEYKYFSTIDTKECSIKKSEALNLAHEVLYNLTIVLGDTKEISLSRIYYALNMITPKRYYPVIQNDTLSLSCSNIGNANLIHTINENTLDIVLNQTGERVGQISFNYYTNSGFTYEGNVGYHIYSPYQNKHYATMALTLLKKLLKTHEFQGEKNLYIATTPDNICSQKVAQNNHAQLVYEGEVPKGEFIYEMAGIKEVKVYCIKI